MIPNIKPSAVYPIKGGINPQAIAAAGTQTSGWLDAKDGEWLKGTLLNGALGGSTLTNLKVEQATSAAGAGAKDLVTNVVNALQVAGTHVQFEVQLANALDLDGGFRYVRVSVTNTGGTGALQAVACEIGPAPYMA